MIASENTSAEKYLKICEQLGQEPDPDKMPPSLSDFPDQVQAAFFLHSVMPDRIDSMAGQHLGKEISGLKDIIDIYKIGDAELVTTFFFYITNKITSRINSKIARERKLTDKKPAAGKPHTIN